MTSWRSRIEASILRSREMKGGNFFQLATVDGDNMPRVRTVVFRGFLGDALTITTDARSQKVKESLCCEVCWWFPVTSEQYRLTATLSYEGHGTKLSQIRKDYWCKLSEKAQAQFYWKGHPKAAYAASGGEDTQTHAAIDEKPIASEREENKDGNLTPPETFVLVLIEPTSCDYLRLTDNYRQIDTLNEDKTSWTSQRVYP